MDCLLERTIKRKGKGLNKLNLFHCYRLSFAVSCIVIVFALFIVIVKVFRNQIPFVVSTLPINVEFGTPNEPREN